MTTTPSDDLRPTVEFDHHGAAFHANRLEEWRTLREQCPVSWNTRHGGFWMVAGFDEVGQAARDGATYSSRYEPEPVDGIDYLGITGVPRSPTIPKAGIAEVEGPVHLALRRAMNPFMVPKAVARAKPLMQRAATWFMDEAIEAGHMDLVADFASPVPAVMTMDLVGLPLHNWQRYAELFHAAVAHRPADAEATEAYGHLPAMYAEMDDAIAEHHAHPRDDLLSALMAIQVDGRRLDDHQLRAVLWNLIGGGLDTTTSLTSLAVHHLGNDTEDRHALIDDPSLLPLATEEFLRYFSVNESLTRTATCPADLGGQHIEAGDHVMISWLSANHDATMFERADEVVLDRQVNPHLAFGVGPHRCIGMHIARVLFGILLTEVLTRIPDYRIDEDATKFYGTNPELNGIVRMPVTFTPGPRVGPDERPF